MAVDTAPPKPQDNSATPSVDPNKLIPGTTVPSKTESPALQSPDSEPVAFSGPSVDGKPTLFTLYEPDQLPSSPYLDSQKQLVNRAFETSHSQANILAGVCRLRTRTQLAEELGRDPGTFTHILRYTGTTDVIGTASAHRYASRVRVVEPLDEAGLQQHTFTRLELPASAVGGDEFEAETWELKFLAVDPTIQRQGVAGALMKVVDDEVKRRFRDRVMTEGKSSFRKSRLVMLLTTVMEINKPFYLRRGYTTDYEDFYEAGHMGSELGFTVGHMSKVLDEV